jgi:integrase/recombinase XerD
MNKALLPVKNTDLGYNLSFVGLNSIANVLPTIEAEVNSNSSWRTYKQDIKKFASWILQSNVELSEITRVDLLSYRKELQEEYANITVNRMFTVARLVIAELVHNGTITGDPLAKKFKALPTNKETTHTVLNEEQCQRLLDAIDRKTLKGLRDYAMVSLMLRCGLRREEVQHVNIGDFRVDRHHRVLDLQGKGDKPATVKIPPDVWGHVEEYMQTLEQRHPRRQASLDAPMFISLRRGGNPSLHPDKTGKLVELRIDIKGIEIVVKELGVKTGVPTLTPHGLRATFITLAMEHGSTLEQAQYAARHEDPRTTERYRKRKLNLDNNAVDKLSFLARTGD